MWTEQALKALARKELQTLAKAHSVKANMKGSEIIAKLLPILTPPREPMEEHGKQLEQTKGSSVSRRLSRASGVPAIAAEEAVPSSPAALARKSAAQSTDAMEGQEDTLLPKKRSSSVGRQSRSRSSRSSFKAELDGDGDSGDHGKARNSTGSRVSVARDAVVMPEQEEEDSEESSLADGPRTSTAPEEARGRKRGSSVGRRSRSRSRPSAGDGQVDTGEMNSQRRSTGSREPRADEELEGKAEPEEQSPASRWLAARKSGSRQSSTAVARKSAAQSTDAKEGQEDTLRPKKRSSSVGRQSRSRSSRSSFKAELDGDGDSGDHGKARNSTGSRVSVARDAVVMPEQEEEDSEESSLADGPRTSTAPEEARGRKRGSSVGRRSRSRSRPSAGDGQVDTGEMNSQRRSTGSRESPSSMVSSDEAKPDMNEGSWSATPLGNSDSTISMGAEETLDVGLTDADSQGRTSTGADQIAPGKVQMAKKKATPKNKALKPTFHKFKAASKDLGKVHSSFKAGPSRQTGEDTECLSPPHCHATTSLRLVS